eukprot:TRINITY_DN7700_c0_g2_i1.p1 TRINITY_DN7700_c0_g2~~TRINITY_DN7700_c0_g2_i1.p1  ORF type:complete len:406 (-),score=59.61 TRINITY_DN7700_c0_g2_i1:37-1254(-)
MAVADVLGAGGESVNAREDGGLLPPLMPWRNPPASATGTRRERLCGGLRRLCVNHLLRRIPRSSRNAVTDSSIETDGVIPTLPTVTLVGAPGRSEAAASPRRGNFNRRRRSSVASADPTAPQSMDFQAMVEEIEAALAGGVIVRSLRKNHALEDRVPPRTRHFYKVALPGRPCRVTVSIERISDCDPILYGSTRSDRPDAISCDIRGADSQLVYEHVLSAEESAEMGVDRRQTGPACKFLYVAADSKASDCHFLVSFSVVRVNVVLSRDELRAHATQSKRTASGRIWELRRSDEMRERFEAEVRIAKRRADQQRKDSWGTDFLAENRESLKEATPLGKLQSIEKRALQREARLEAAYQRRKAQSGTDDSENSSVSGVETDVLGEEDAVAHSDCDANQGVSVHQII